ncbi:hypothetical protein F3Y22_tig00110647pilonHSYRG00077 [Hibiscus syriacus]|uniref:Phospholipase/carboxylesterase/thioesterase domain-containing protein n=1 Tax=Hibiscus syriacus TaxID=106335 RepID=A0A6A3A056_HIBSY|nr:hypothetical protein F3Y22_tig00110647pilonHSYRG00077 [Hibiscus syriacus]
MAARSFVLWLHGLGESGPANESIKTLFRSPKFRNTKWSFPSAPENPVTCNYGIRMPSWFEIHEIPVTAWPQRQFPGFGVNLCPDSALTLASVLLYPKKLGRGAVFSGRVPFNSSMIKKFPEDAKKTPILWSHGMADRTVLFEAGQAGPPFLEQAGVTCEFKIYMPFFSDFLVLFVWHLLICRNSYAVTGLSWSWPFNKQRRAAVPRIMD